MTEKDRDALAEAALKMLGAAMEQIGLAMTVAEVICRDMPPEVRGEMLAAMAQFETAMSDFKKNHPGGE